MICFQSFRKNCAKLLTASQFFHINLVSAYLGFTMTLIMHIECHVAKLNLLITSIAYAYLHNKHWTLTLFSEISVGISTEAKNFKIKNYTIIAIIHLILLLLMIIICKCNDSKIWRFCQTTTTVIIIRFK